MPPWSSVGTPPRRGTAVPRDAPHLLRRAGGSQIRDIELQQEQELNVRRCRRFDDRLARAKLLSVLERAAAIMNEDEDEE